MQLLQLKLLRQWWRHLKHQNGMVFDLCEKFDLAVATDEVLMIEAVEQDQMRYWN